MIFITVLPLWGWCTEWSFPSISKYSYKKFSFDHDNINFDLTTQIYFVIFHIK